jgi:hypothetical protein
MRGKRDWEFSLDFLSNSYWSIYDFGKFMRLTCIILFFTLLWCAQWNYGLPFSPLPSTDRVYARRIFGGTWKLPCSTWGFFSPYVCFSSTCAGNGSLQGGDELSCEIVMYFIFLCLRFCWGNRSLKAISSVLPGSVHWSDFKYSTFVEIVCANHFNICFLCFISGMIWRT